jgi:hypothetical protein
MARALFAMNAARAEVSKEDVGHLVLAMESCDATLPSLRQGKPRRRIL